jgi:hypothetical protein
LKQMGNLRGKYNMGREKIITLEIAVQMTLSLPTLSFVQLHRHVRGMAPVIRGQRTTVWLQRTAHPIRTTPPVLNVGSARPWACEKYSY